MTAAGYFADAAEAALATLFVPLETGVMRIPPDGPVLFLGALAGPWARDVARSDWTCQQSFLPFADELGRLGLRVREPDPEERFALVMVLPRRQRDERRAMFARALLHLAPGGTLLAAAANVEGARSAQSDLARLTGPLQEVSKHKCRVFWGAADAGSAEPGLLDAWHALDALREIPGGYLSRPGLFAWDHVDRASALLAGCLPGDLGGRVADLGAGYGYLGAQVIAQCPLVTSLDLYEAEQRAVEPARLNLQHALALVLPAGGRQVPELDIRWHDVTRGLPRVYDAIVSNPPFHQGRADQPQLGQAFINSAADALHEAGRLLVVANRHLPYEAVLRSRFREVHPLAERDGFKVLEARGVRR